MKPNYFPKSNLLKRTLTFAALTLLLIPGSFANTLYVEPGGAGGAFTSITAAVNAANPSGGDVIQVFPQNGGSAYVENVVITKNLTLMTAVQGQQYVINGTIEIVNAACSAIISDANVTNREFTNYTLLISGGTCTTPARVVDCTFNGPVYCTNARYTFFDHDVFNPSPNGSAASAELTFSRGRVTGCIFNNMPGLVMSILPSSAIGTDTVSIVGNSINIVATFGSAVIVNNPHQYLFISNNLMTVTGGSQAVPSEPFIELDSLKVSTATPPVYNYVLNNTMLNLSQGTFNYLPVGIQIGGAANTPIDIENNIYYGLISFGQMVSGSLSESNLIFSYNYSNAPFNGSEGTLVNGGASAVGNQYQMASLGIAANGALLSGPAMNGGNPDYRYLDLDLTRNDAGCYGGSLSLANFTTTSPGSNVLYMTAPRTVLSNQPFSISADGAAK